MIYVKKNRTYLNVCEVLVMEEEIDAFFSLLE